MLDNSGGALDNLGAGELTGGAGWESLTGGRLTGRGVPLGVGTPKSGGRRDPVGVPELGGRGVPISFGGLWGMMIAQFITVRFGITRRVWWCIRRETRREWQNTRREWQSTRREWCIRREWWCIRREWQSTRRGCWSGSLMVCLA